MNPSIPGLPRRKTCLFALLKSHEQQRGAMLLLRQDAAQGAPVARRGCGGKVRRRARRMCASSLYVQGRAFNEPRSALAHSQHRDCAESAPPGCAFFRLPFFAQAKKGDSLARRASESPNPEEKTRREGQTEFQLDSHHPGARPLGQLRCSRALRRAQSLE
jgi:hypothetical protein